jgi:FkbM family methyltransferase
VGYTTTHIPMVTGLLRQILFLFEQLRDKSSNPYLLYITRTTIISDFVRQAFNILGYIRIVRSIKITTVVEKNSKVDFLGGSIYWPKYAKLEQLKSMIVEVYWPAHPHYYESYGSRIKAQDIVFDCGACEGLFARKIASQCKHVFAFEPSQQLQNILIQNCLPYLQSNQITIVPKLLGVSSKTVKFVDLQSNPALSRIVDHSDNRREVIEVPMTTIDEFVQSNSLEKVDYIKADVEGSEIQLLRGAVETIKKYSPRIAITTYHEPNHANEIVDLLMQINPRYKFQVVGVVKLDGINRPVMAHFW